MREIIYDLSNMKKFLFCVKKTYDRLKLLMKNSTGQHRIKFLFLFLLVVSCGTIDPFKQSQQELDIKIKAFNFEFESKAFERAARFVHPDFLNDFQQKSLEVFKNTTFLENTILDLKLFMDDQQVRLTSSDSSEDFNRSEVTILYQVSILPSTKLKTIIVEQEWIKWNDSWLVNPKIDLFLN
jgi:hypothetical protein